MDDVWFPVEKLLSTPKTFSVQRDTWLVVANIK